MSSFKSVGVHLALTLVASVSAFSLWSKEEEPDKGAGTSAEVRVWSGKPDQLETIAFEGKELKVKLEPKKDELGQWFVVYLNQVKKAARPPTNPHAPPEKPEPEPEAKGEWVKSNFVS